MALTARTAAAQIIGQILRQQGSLSSLLPATQARLPESERPFLQELCSGTLRWQPRLDTFLQRLLDKPLRGKDSDIQALLLLGLYQLTQMRVPDHAAISETVEAARPLKKPWATKLINGVLRRFQREREEQIGRASCRARAENGEGGGRSAQEGRREQGPPTRE